MPGAVTLDELLGKVDAFAKGAESATQQVVAALDTQAKLTTDIGTVYKQQATDDGTVAAAKNAADYATQLARVKAANALGTNLKNNQEVITGLAQASQDAFQRKTEALSHIQQIQNTSFLDHPIDYIVGQFQLPSEIAKHNIANQQMQNADERIQQLNILTQQTAVTQNAISEPLTAAAVEAATRNASVAATVAAKRAEIDGISYGTKGIEFALNAKKEELQNLFQVKQAQNSETQLDLARQGLALQTKEFAERQYEFDQRQSDRKEQQQLAQSVVDTVNLGRKLLLGADAPPLDDVSGKMLIATLKNKGTLSTELQKYYDAGERSRVTGTTVVGATPAAAAETLQAVPVKLNPTQGAIKSILQQAASDTNQAIKDADFPGKNKNPVFQGIDKKNKDSINSAFNGRAQQLLNEAATVIKPGDSDNPYQIGSINQLASNSPTIQGLPVYQKVLAPLIKSGVQLNDPSQVIALAGDAVAKGVITHKQALELTTIYHVGVGANLAMRNFQGFGLAPKWSYNAKVETDPSAWTTSEVVNMTDPSAVSRAILKRQASIYRDKMMSGEVNIFSGKSNDTKANELFNPSDATRKSLQFGPQSPDYKGF